MNEVKQFVIEKEIAATRINADSKQLAQESNIFIEPTVYTSECDGIYACTHVIIPPGCILTLTRVGGYNDA